MHIFKNKRNLIGLVVVVLLIGGIVYMVMMPKQQKKDYPKKEMPGATPLTVFEPSTSMFDPGSLDITGIQTNLSPDDYNTSYAQQENQLNIPPDTRLPAFPPYLNTLPNLPVSMTPAMYLPGFGGFIA